MDQIRRSPSIVPHDRTCAGKYYITGTSTVSSLTNNHEQGLMVEHVMTKACSTGNIFLELHNYTTKGPGSD